jgi:hypothetical protein
MFLRVSLSANSHVSTHGMQQNVTGPLGAAVPIGETLPDGVHEPPDAESERRKSP